MENANSKQPSTSHNLFETNFLPHTDMRRDRRRLHAFYAYFSFFFFGARKHFSIGLNRAITLSILLFFFSLTCVSWKESIQYSV